MPQLPLEAAIQHPTFHMFVCISTQAGDSTSVNAVSLFHYVVTLQDAQANPDGTLSDGPGICFLSVRSTAGIAPRVGFETYRGGKEAWGLGDKKGLRGGTGGPGRVFGGGENGAGLYSFSLACREAAGPAADGSEPPVREPGTCKSFEHDARDG